MSSGLNHRREHDKINDNGPRYENHTPCKGCNSTHVARSRSKWKRRAARAERRMGLKGGSYKKFIGSRYRIKGYIESDYSDD